MGVAYMRKRWFLWALCFILGISAVMATDSADLQTYYSWDINASDDYDNNTGTPVNAVHNTTVKQMGAGSYYFNNVDAYIDVYTLWPDLSTLNTGSVCVWSQGNSPTDGGVFFMPSKGDTSNANIFQINGGGTLDATIYTAAQQWAIVTSDSLMITDDFNFICLTHDGFSSYLLVNGTVVDQSYDFTTDKTKWWNDMTNVGFAYVGAGRWSGGNNFFYSGYLDEMSFWTANMTEEYAAVLYNSGAGCDLNCILGITENPGLTITATHLFDSVSVQDFNVTISNSTFSQTVESNFSSGEAFIANITDGNYTVNVSNKNFFNLSYDIELLNVNATIESNLTQAYLLSEAFHAVTGVRVNNFNVTVATQSNETANGTSYLITAGGTNTAIFDSSGYHTQSLDVTQANLTTAYVQWNVSSHQLNVTANYYTGSINNFTANITRLDTDFTQTESSTVTTGVASFDILNGTYNITMEAPGYSFASTSILINASDSYTTVTFNLLEQNSFNVTFSDTVTHDIITTDNITFEIYSDAFANNYSTTNGTLLITLLTPSAYRMRYSGTQYPEHFYYFNLSNNTFNNLELYMHASDIASNITVSITDQYNNPVENARIQSYRFFLPENADVLQEIQFTDFEGNGIVNGELGEEFYRFFIYYNNVLYKSTSRAYLESTTLSIPITIGQTTGAQYFTYIDDLAISLFYDNVSESFNYSYADSTATASNACLVLYETTNLSQTLINTTCLTGSSGSFTITLTPTNGTTYSVDAFINQSGVSYYMGSLYAAFDPTGKPNYGSDALWLAIILTLVLTAFAATFGAPYAVITAPLPTTIMTYLGLLNFDVVNVTGIALIFLIFGLGVVRS